MNKASKITSSWFLFVKGFTKNEMKGESHAPEHAA
jgi:hypothetical protein